jgi:hypothetical protein
MSNISAPHAPSPADTQSRDAERDSIFIHAAAFHPPHIFMIGMHAMAHNADLCGALNF